MKNEERDFQKIQERLKFFLLTQLISDNMHSLEKKFSDISDTSIAKFFEGKNYTQKKMAYLLKQDEGAFSKFFTFKPWVLNYKIDFKDFKSFTQLEEKLNAEQKKEFENLRSVKNYANAINYLLNKFHNCFTWSEDEFNWKFLENFWPISNIIDNNLPANFSDTSWYIYKNIKTGIQRMILSIAAARDKEGFYNVTIKDALPYSKGEYLVYEGKVFSDARKHKKTNRLIFLLKDSDSDRYAHLILFNRGDRVRDENICIGHFTYFSNRSHTKKYLTKFVILELQEKRENLSPAILLESQCNDSEKVFFSFLSDREKSRLTSLQDPPRNLRDFKSWVHEHRAEKFKQLTAYPRTYELCYIKKCQIENNITYEFYRDELIFSYRNYSPDIIATFRHMKNVNDDDYGKRRDIAYQIYQGKINIIKGYVYGVLLKEDLPLYLSIHISDDAKYTDEHFFIGSITAEGDRDTVMVTYSCILVPIEILDVGNNRAEKLPKIRKYLKDEAMKGWGTVDPSNRRVRKKTFDDLFL
ncbi:MAG: hypothetical protein U0X91_08735 [Spirosomataceae bacterium]